jgi:hypothetical protein
VVALQALDRVGRGLRPVCSPTATVHVLPERHPVGSFCQSASAAPERVSPRDVGNDPCKIRRRAKCLVFVINERASAALLPRLDHHPFRFCGVAWHPEPAIVGQRFHEQCCGSGAIAGAGAVE